MSITLVKVLKKERLDFVAVERARHRSETVAEHKVRLARRRIANGARHSSSRESREQKDCGQFNRTK